MNDLLVTCAVAFVAVFFLLAFLALVQRMLVALFPVPAVAVPKEPDAALLAALTTILSAAYPGTAITKIEEER
jgi:hypothetical protein